MAPRYSFTFPVRRLYGFLPIWAKVRSELEQEWHRLRLSVAEMIHFIRQMQAYSQLEVIECSWADLMDFVHKKEGDLDALIAAHRDYLGRLVRKILLLSNKAGREVGMRKVNVLPMLTSCIIRRLSLTKSVTH